MNERLIMIADSKQSSRLMWALLCAALLLALPLLAKLLPPTYAASWLGQRLLGIMMGVVVMLYANVVPKALRSLSHLQCNPATEQSIRRFGGWSLVLGGLGYVLAWLFAPIAQANMLAVALLGTALCALLLR